MDTSTFSGACSFFDIIDATGEVGVQCAIQPGIQIVQSNYHNQPQRIHDVCPRYHMLLGSSFLLLRNVLIIFKKTMIINSN